MAGVSRQQYATDIRLIRVMCSGRIDLAFVLKAFANGMDGVFIGACRLNECNYITHGNYHALNMVQLCKKILEYAGMNPARLQIALMSSADGGLFTDVMNAFSKQIRELGPLGTSDYAGRPAILAGIEEARRLVPYIKIVKRQKLALRLGNKEEYEALYTPDEVTQLLRDVVSYHIAPDKCKACMICARRCPADAITGGKNRIHIIDQEKCIKCGTCYDACPARFAAVTKICGEPVPPPIPEEKRTLAAKANARQKDAGPA